MGRAVFRLAVLLISALAAQPLMAQSTIFNIPTTDTVAKGKTYIEFDFLPQIPEPDFANRAYTYNPRLVVGVSSDVEAGVNAPFFQTPPTTNVFLEPNLKWRFFNDDKAGIAAAVGGIVFTPVNHRDGQPTYAQLYGEFSKKVKSGMYGPRFTLGAYGVVNGGESWVGPRAGALVGYEQPIQSKISVVADWFSGKNTFGYFTPGISITLPANGVFNAGYSLGNNSYHGNDNRFLYLFYGITF
jgi:hypothetical protein